MNPFALNRRTITYIDHFLDEVKHLHNIILIKSVVARTDYRAICKLKIYRKCKGVWERFSQHIIRVKCERSSYITRDIT